MLILPHFFQASNSELPVVIIPLVPEPVVTLTSPTDLLYLNRTEATEITCNASLENNTAVDIQDEIFFAFGWINTNGSELFNSSRVTILFPTATSSVLSLLPLSTLDTNITCYVVANASLADIQASSVVTVTGLLTLQSKNEQSVS